MKIHEYYVISRLLDALFRTEEALNELIGAEAEAEKLDDRYKEIRDGIDMLIDETIELRKKFYELFNMMNEVMKNE